MYKFGTGLRISEYPVFLISLLDKFEKKSREASVEPPSTRPAEPYVPGEDDSKEEESLENSDSNLPDEEDDDDIA